MSDTPHRRAYSAPSRDRARRETLARIRACAQERFLRSGYVSTTIDAVALDAGVTARYVHLAFGGKSELLSHVISTAVVGDDDRVALAERDAWRAAMAGAANSDFAPFADVNASVLGRTAVLLEVADAAAAGDPAIAAMRVLAHERRHRDCSTIVEAVPARALSQGLSAEDAVDLLYTLASPANYLMLVRERGWSVLSYRRWLRDATSGMLLAR